MWNQVYRLSINYTHRNTKQTFWKISNINLDIMFMTSYLTWLQYNLFFLCNNDLVYIRKIILCYLLLIQYQFFSKFAFYSLYKFLKWIENGQYFNLVLHYIILNYNLHQWYMQHNWQNVLKLWQVDQSSGVGMTCVNRQVTWTFHHHKVWQIIQVTLYIKPDIQQI